jgi:hypothetical protein
MDERKVAGIPIEILDRILSEIELELHQVRIGFGEENVVRKLAIYRPKLEIMVVIRELDRELLLASPARLNLSAGELRPRSWSGPRPHFVPCCCGHR